MKSTCACIVLAYLALGTAVASAQTSYTKDNYPQQFNRRPLTLAAEQYEITGDLTFGLDNNAAFKRIHLTPDFYYGIDKKLTIGVSHHYFATPWNNTFTSRSLCIGSACGNAYTNISPDVKYSLTSGDVAVALQGGADVSSFDPAFTLGLRFGALIRVRAGDSFFIDMAPSLRLGLIGRNYSSDFLNLPIRVAYQVSKELAPFLESGLTAPLDGFNRGLLIPLGLGANVALDRQFDLGAALRFPAFLNGIDGLGPVDFRELGVFGAYRF
jgi:hypothetical protein